MNSFIKKAFSLLLIGCFLVLGLGVVRVNAATVSLVFDFEDNTAHRTSGSNSYNSNSYSENEIDIELNYADSVTTGSPLNGSANIMARVAKNTTNSPFIIIGPIDITQYESLSNITYNTKGVAAMSLNVSYSSNKSTWTDLQSIASMPTSKTKEEINNLSISEYKTFYLKFQITVGSSTSSNRDAQFDDIQLNFVVPDKHVTGVSLDKANLDLFVGDTETLTATITPDDATNKNVSWSSSDDDVATVDEDGLVTAVGVGNATITVTTEDGSYTDSCDVSVIEIVLYLVLNLIVMN